MDIRKNSLFFKALGHPVRLRIVEGLANGKECNVNTMVENMNLPQSTVSQHLGILKNQGIVAYRKNGVETCYFIADTRVKKILKDLE
ncbi:MAG: winged helix-turn-helix transcriptional regulator [Spirochaetales bacterium]|nr:winged helix-turn-helix transcriptional regulator [Spirochaetales bacterium]